VWAFAPDAPSGVPAAVLMAAHGAGAEGLQRRGVGRGADAEAMWARARAGERVLVADAAKGGAQVRRSGNGRGRGRGRGRGEEGERKSGG
jgi:hypothetical protein